VLAAQRRIAFLLFGAVALAWAVTVERMEGMDAGPGTDLGGLGWYLGVWVTMTAAMMLPSEAPAALLVARLRRSLPAVLYLVGYLAVWTAYGLAAYAVFGRDFGTGVAALVVGGAGVYELTPLKRRSLERCRNPHPNGGLRSGLTEGVHCVGASGGLMAVLFALGVMSVLWMVVVAAVIFAEKVLPQGLRLTRPVAIALLAFAIWVATSPSSVPGLTEPGMAPMEMEA
jgi:predicted metal-binding membrane protein